MARAEGMALAPFNVLAGGKIRTDEEEERRRQTGEHGRTVFSAQWERSEKEKAACKALEKVVHDVGAKSITAGTFLKFRDMRFSLTHLSRNCISIAQDPLRLPRYWGS